MKEHNEQEYKYSEQGTPVVLTPKGYSVWDTTQRDALTNVTFYIRIVGPGSPVGGLNATASNQT